jgi:glyoxylase-like metal-dependent hydrolase (beta-lactamase superfamily II)
LLYVLCFQAWRRQRRKTKKVSAIRHQPSGKTPSLPGEGCDLIPDSLYLKRNKGMELEKGLHFLKVDQKGILDSSNILVIRDGEGLNCIEVGGGGEEKIRQTLTLFEQEGLDTSEIRTVTISHTHADHMGAIAYLREQIPGMVVIDHEADAPYLQDNTLLNRIFDSELVAKYFPEKQFDILELYAAFCPISETSPDRTVREGDVLEWGEYAFEVIHTPGHHPGHISLYEPDEKILFVGDMLGREVPFYTPSSGGVEGYLASMEKYRALQIDSIIPSHGDLIEDAQEAIEIAVSKVKQREERVLDALGGRSMIFNELLPALFRNPAQHTFPGAAILASHLEKLKKEGIVQEEDGTYGLPGS